MRDGCICATVTSYQTFQYLDNLASFQGSHVYHFSFGCPIHKWTVKHDFFDGEYSIYLAYLGSSTSSPSSSFLSSGGSVALPSSSSSSTLPPRTSALSTNPTHTDEPVNFYFMVTDANQQMVKRRDFTRVLKWNTFYGYPKLLTKADVVEVDAFPLKVTTCVTLLKQMERTTLLLHPLKIDQLQEHWMDVRLQLANGELWANRFLLSIANDYFAKLFSCGMKESKSLNITLPETVQDFSVLLDYVHTRTLSVPTHLFSSVYIAADKYGFDMICAHIIFAVNDRTSPSILVDMLRTVWDVGKKKHKEHLLEVVTRNLDVLMKDDYFKQFMVDGQCGAFAFDLICSLK